MSGNRLLRSYADSLEPSTLPRMIVEPFPTADHNGAADHLNPNLGIVDFLEAGDGCTTSVADRLGVRPDLTAVLGWDLGVDRSLQSPDPIVRLELERVGDERVDLDGHAFP